jgi:AcrR family transcriptional regulator
MTRARLQQDRSRATRRAIIATAEALWREHGFDAVSVEQVCQAADVAKGTFYFYFPRKEHLLVMTVFGRFMPRDTELKALLDSELDTAQICAELLTAIGQRVKKIDKNLVLRAVEESFRHYRQIGKLEGGDHSLHSFYEPIFERGVARGDVNKAWDLDLIARTLGWATLQEIFWWASGQSTLHDLLPDLRQRAELIANGARFGQPAITAPKVSSPAPRPRSAPRS